MQHPSAQSRFVVTKSLFFWLYISLGVIHLFWLLAYGKEGWVYMISKSSLMPVLALHFWVHRSRNQDFTNLLTLGALLFSLSGDVWLMFEGSTYFLLGLGSFLIAHVLYILLFSLPSSENSQPSYLKRKPWLVLPFVMYLGILLSFLRPGLGNMVLPVTVYGTVISLMGLTALNRWGKAGERSFSWVFLGALLFMLSDSLIALGKFASDMILIPLLSFWVMLTYISAQYFIIQGLIEQAPPKHDPRLN